MKNSLEQQIINARPDDHPSHPDFVAKTMAAVKASSARETFSHVNRRMNETNKKGLFMKLRSLSKPALAAIAVVVVLVVSGTVYAAYQITHRHSTLKSSHHHVNSPVTPDPTKNWTPFSSILGKFSLRYPTTWVQPDHREFCTDGLFDRTLYLGPDTKSVLTCASENFGQMSVSSVDGDKRSDYELGTGYKDIVKKEVKVNRVSGQRISGVAAAKSDVNDVFAPLEGTIEVHYVFYTNGMTYSARYTQVPAGHVPSTDVLKDFDLMITKTLTFAKTTTPPISSAPERCHTAELTLSLIPQGAAAGSRYELVALTNKSARTCIIQGYPGVSLVDAHGALMGQPAQQDPNAFNNATPTMLTLNPNDAAYARAGGFPNGNEGSQTCYDSTSLRVYPPGETGSLLVGDKEKVCTGGFYISFLVSKQQAGE